MDSFTPRARTLLFVGLTPVFIALIWYSLTWSFIWDEGFHLVAAQLIASGKRPYIDFCFPQTPLNAYINAAILLIAGNRWRPVHLVAAIYICAAVWLVADFVQSRLPADRWRTPCALASGVLFGLNMVVVQFGPAGQAYAIGMLCVTAAFRAALPGVWSARSWFTFLSGLCAGIAAGSTLLTAPVSVVLLCWSIFGHKQGSRVKKIAAFFIGCILPFGPVLWLYLEGPKQTIFNVLQYQTLFRRTNWGDANLHDLGALTSWLVSPATLLLIAFFLAAVIFLFRERSACWQKAWHEFSLAAILGVALLLFISTAHPTFERYYAVAVPFFAAISGLGIYAAGHRLASSRHSWLTASFVIALSWGIFFRALFDERDDEHWSAYEDLARHAAIVTPLGANLYADELVYFILGRTPPEGMAFSYAQKLQLPPAQEKLMHIVSLTELKKLTQSGYFATLQTCRDSIVDDFQAGKYFKHHSQIGDCDLFWQPKLTPPSTVER